MQTLGVIDNVIPCADPAYVIAPDIKADIASKQSDITIGINLSPLSIRHSKYSLEEAIHIQSRTIQELIKPLDARIVLIPHVVCDFMEGDDDLRYLHRLKQAIASEYQEAVTLLNNDIGFVGTKKELIKCDLVIAARMHCAINVLGAINPFTMTLIYVATEGYVNAERVCQLLRQIKQRGFKDPITLVLDNARYQRCQLVQALAASLKIELLFLPSYSPNLNLIERYWKYLKGKLFRCRSIDKFESFCTSILSILDDRSEKRKKELATLLTPKFQIFDEAAIC